MNYDAYRDTKYIIFKSPDKDVINYVVVALNGFRYRREETEQGYEYKVSSQTSYIIPPKHEDEFMAALKKRYPLSQIIDVVDGISLSFSREEGVDAEIVAQVRPVEITPDNFQVITNWCKEANRNPDKVKQIEVNFNGISPVLEKYLTRNFAPRARDDRDQGM